MLLATNGEPSAFVSLSMFEQEVERTKKRLRQLIAAQQTYVPLQAILAEPTIHSAYRAFFRAEVQWWVYEEQAIRAGNPRFDASIGDVQQLSRRLDELNAQHARFDQEELAATIDAAVKTRLNMLARPRTTLKWFVFRGEPTRTVREILLRLDYLVDHAYIADGVRAWLRSRGAETSPFELVSVVEFERIVEKVDNDAILELSQGQFVSLLDGLFEFFADANPDLPPECVPTESVIIFLDDKGAVPLSQALERLLYRESLTHVTRSRILDVIDVVLASFEDPDAKGIATTTLGPIEAGTPQVEEEPSSVDVETSTSGVVNEPKPVVEEGVTSVDDKAPTHDVEVLPPPAEAPASDLGGFSNPAEEPREIAPEGNPEPLIIQSEQGASEGVGVDSAEDDGSTQRVARLRVVMDERTLDKVIRKIFVRDKALYEQTVRKVLRAGTWKEAVGALDRFYAENEIEANSAVAMELSLAIRQSYRH